MEISLLLGCKASKTGPVGQILARPIIVNLDQYALIKHSLFNNKSISCACSYPLEAQDNYFIAKIKATFTYRFLCNGMFKNILLSSAWHPLLVS